MRRDAGQHRPCGGLDEQSHVHQPEEDGPARAEEDVADAVALCDAGVVVVLVEAGDEPGGDGEFDDAEEDDETEDDCDGVQ